MKEQVLSRCVFFFFCIVDILKQIDYVPFPSGVTSEGGNVQRKP